MRIASRLSSAVNSAYFLSHTGVKTHVYGGIVQYVSSSLNRSDVTRNAKDASGWRKPSAYQAIYTSAAAGDIYARVHQPFNQRYVVEEGKPQANTNYPAYTITEGYLNGFLPPQNDIAQATIKARNNVADRIASFGESIAELMKTLSNLKDLASQVDKFITAALAKDFNAVADALGIPRRVRKHRRAVMRYNKLGIPTVSNAFLCWNFGLSPIVSDMVALAIAMGQGKPLRIVGKALVPRETGEQPVTIVRPGGLAHGGTGYKAYFRETRRSGTYVRLDYEINIEELRQLTSYGLLDAPATIWALVPYSFLVDFVLPVSEVLRSLTATHGLTFKGGTATRFVTIDRRYSNVVPNKDTRFEIWKDLRFSVPDLRGVKMDRSVFSSDPNPVTLWVKDPFGAFEAATVFSLLGQKLGARRFH